MLLDLTTRQPASDQPLLSAAKTKQWYVHRLTHNMHSHKLSKHGTVYFLKEGPSCARQVLVNELLNIIQCRMYLKFLVQQFLHPISMPAQELCCVAIFPSHLNACTRTLLGSMHASHIFSNTNTTMHCRTWICVRKCDTIPDVPCHVITNYLPSAKLA